MSTDRCLQGTPRTRVTQGNITAVFKNLMFRASSSAVIFILSMAFMYNGKTQGCYTPQASAELKGECESPLIT